MFSNAATVKLYVSDFHMSVGAKSQHEDFKYHPPGVPFSDTSCDFILDQYFDDFINWIIRNLNHCPDVQLCLNGDIFDFSMVSLPGESFAFPYEKEAAEKFKIIMNAHSLFFEALKRFCAENNTKIKFFKGNHDWELNWPAVQNLIIQRISPEKPEKVCFLYEESDLGTYCRHGENEPNIKNNNTKPIINFVDLAKLPSALKKARLNFVLREVLDVPLSYYLISDLMYHLKPFNYLMGRMHTHGFMYTDTIKNLFRPSSWYRDWRFAFAAAYYFFRILFYHVLFVRFWHVKMKTSLKKIIQLIWWTVTGVVKGTTPRDSALKILHNQDDINCVIYSHEHEYTFEMIQVNNNVKTYINTGTWTPQIREKTAEKIIPWKRFVWIQDILRFIRGWFTKPELELVWKCSAALETVDENGNTNRRLVEWDREEKTLKQIS